MEGTKEIGFRVKTKRSLRGIRPRGCKLKGLFEVGRALSSEDVVDRTGVGKSALAPKDAIGIQKNVADGPC